ncbi:MAG: 3'(2'),5'-bisphosphate nucleotidase CysQ [Syntrophobacteraceae bacterium]
MIDIDGLSALARQAGRAILDVYGTEFTVQEKEDCSPLTKADMRSHTILSQGLQELFPDIPVLSEEGKQIDPSTRARWSRFWLVDPLDGTKEFIKRNGEFTINIGLIEGHTPVFGLIYIPVQDLLFVGDTREGCWETAAGKTTRLAIDPGSIPQAVRVVKSRSHPSPNLQALLELLPDHDVVMRGSALKFCSVAKGEADFYPRFGPTWEWDTAAGEAIVRAAGGVMVDLRGNAFVYNKPELLNGPFMVASSLTWLQEKGLLERAASLAASD